jgi:hypothetical protein
MVDTQYQAYQRQYSETLTHLYELDKPFLVNSLIVDTDITGMTKVFDRLGSIPYKKKTGRNEIATLEEPDFSARHLSVGTYYAATPYDMEDISKMVGNPQSDLYQETLTSIYYAQTDVAMTSFFADVVINEDGGSTSSFPAGNQIAVNYSGGTFGQNSGAANVGLNVDKLLKVKSNLSKKKLYVNTSDRNSLNIAICEDDMQSLMASKIGSDNYPMLDRLNTMMIQFEKAADNIIDGTFKWNAFTFHVLPQNFFQTDASGYRRLPVWVKDGMVYGMKVNVTSEMERLPSTVESYKIQALTRVGGLRKHDDKVYEIKVTP